MRPSPTVNATSMSTNRRPSSKHRDRLVRIRAAADFIRRETERIDYLESAIGDAGRIVHGKAGWRVVLTGNDQFVIEEGKDFRTTLDIAIARHRARVLKDLELSNWAALRQGNRRTQGQSS